MDIPLSGTGRTAATVGASWKRIEAWIDEHVLIRWLTLRPGISKRDLAKYEKRNGQQIPDGWRSKG